MKREQEVAPVSGQPSERLLPLVSTIANGLLFGGQPGLIFLFRDCAVGKEFRGALMRALDAVRENHAVRYLSDTRKVKVIVHEDQRWADETWFPLAAAAGLKRFAAVTAGAGLGKLTVEEVFDAVHLKGFELSKFRTVADARRWLAEI